MHDDIAVENEKQLAPARDDVYHMAPAKGWSDLHYMLLFLIIILVVFWKIVLTGEYTILWSGDNSREAYAWMQYLARSIHVHALPFWNPYSEAGRLFIGEPTTGVFYPLNLLFALFPLRANGLQPGWVLEYLVVVHFLIAAALMYLLARHLRFQRFGAAVAALTFTFCGSLSFRATSQISIFTASVWLPGVFWAYSLALGAKSLRKQVVFANLGGLALALCLLAGHHQPFLYCSTSVAIVAVALFFRGSISFCDGQEQLVTRRQIIQATAFLFVFALMYSSLQVLPTLEYSHHAYRWIGDAAPVAADSNVPYAKVATSYILHPQDLATAVFPFLRWTENAIYLGILPLLLVAFSVFLLRKSALVRILWLMAAVFFFTTMGDLFPVHGILYELLPGWSKGREAIRGLVMTHFSLALLAGVGCQGFLAVWSKKQRKYRLWLVWCFGVFSVALTLLLFAFQLAGVTLKSEASFDSLSTACLLLLITAALGLARVYGGVRKKGLRVAIIVVLALDYGAYMSPRILPKQGFNRTSNYEPTRYYQKDEVIRFLQSQPGVFRTSFDEHYSRNLGEVEKLDTIDGYGATRIRWFQDFVFGPHGQDLLNVRYIVSKKDLGGQPVFQSGPEKVFVNPDCFSRAWLATHIVVANNNQRALGIVQHATLDLKDTAVVETKLNSELAPMAGNLANASAGDNVSSPAALFQRGGPNRFSVHVQVLRPSILVVSETWYPGWRATVNGVKREIWRTDGALMGVYLQPGANDIQFRFRPTQLYKGLALTALGLGILLGLAWPGAEKV